MGSCFSKRPKFHKIPTSDVDLSKQIGNETYFYDTEGRRSFAIPEGGFTKPIHMPEKIYENEDNPPKYDDSKEKEASRMISKDDGNGALISLIAYGQEDEKYLTGHSHITLFKPVYKRHTNFSMQTFEIESQERAKLGNKVVYKIPRNGDLINKMMLEIKLPTILSNFDKDYNWIPNIGFSMIEYIDFEIGGRMIDRHPGEWLAILHELTTPSGQREMLDKMVGNTPSSRYARNIKVPLKFFFNKLTEQAIPLIALQYMELKIIVKFRPVEQLVVPNYGYNTPSGNDFKLETEPEIHLYCDYIYLDTCERKRFKIIDHEYLVSLLQYEEFTLDPANPVPLELKSFYYPVKELIFTVQPEDSASTGKGCCNFGSAGDKELFTSARILINGTSRGGIMDTDYLRLVQNMNHHTNIPSSNIYTYSFALRPEDMMQPSGTTNFSILSSKILELQFSENQKKKWTT
jgi:hypothetical protein